MKINGKVLAIVVATAEDVVRFEPAAALPLELAEELLELLEAVGFIQVEAQPDDAAIARSRSVDQVAGEAAAASSAATSAAASRGKK